MNIYVNDLGQSGTGGPYLAALGMSIAVYSAGANDSPIYTGLSNSSVAENQPAGTTVGRLDAIEPDAGDAHTFTLVPGAGDIDNSSFTITGNTLKANATFDYEAKSAYSIRVRAMDIGGLWHEEALTINVTNVNEAPTLVAPIPDVTVGHDAPDTVFNLYPYFHDPEDSAAQLSYTAVGNTNPALFTAVDISHPNQFRLDYATGVSGAADITIRATDTGGLFVEDTFHVNVVANIRPVAYGSNPSASYPYASNLNEDPPSAYQFQLSGNPGEYSQTLTFHIADLSSLHGNCYRDSGTTQLLGS